MTTVRSDIPERDDVVVFRQTKYHFRKNIAGHLTCEVDDEEALQFILSRGSQFSIYGDEQIAELERQLEEAEGEPEGEGVEDKSLEEENPPIATLVDGDEDEAPAAPVKLPLEQRTHEELEALYLEKFGKVAHPATKHATLVERLREAGVEG